MKVECFGNHFSLAMYSSQKGQDTKIRKTDKKNQQNNQENQTKPKFVSVFFFFLLLKHFYYFIVFFPASFVNKSTCKFI